MSRSYLDWNATTPLRVEARAAMLAAMDISGNPSSVHAEGRAARALMEKSRNRIAAALGAEGADIIFTSGATESAALACAGRNLFCANIEHEALVAWCNPSLPVNTDGSVIVPDPQHSALQLANSETGIVQTLPAERIVGSSLPGTGAQPPVSTSMR